MPPLARRSERTRPRRRDEIRDRLLTALKTRIEEGRSFAAIRVDELVADAGISRATFYIHFQDKIQLLEEWLTQTRRALFDAGDAWYSGSSDLTRAELKAKIATIFDCYWAHRTLMGAMHETALYDPTLREEFADAFRVHITSLANHIRRGQTTGDIPRTLDAEPTAGWLIYMLERVPMVLTRTARTTDRNQHVGAMTAVIWSTLYAAAQTHA